MKRLVECPAGHRFKCDHMHLGRKVLCPHPGCDLKFRLEAVDDAVKSSPLSVQRACDRCGKVLEDGAVLCLRCGRRYDTGEQLATNVMEDSPGLTQLLYSHRVERAAAEKRASVDPPNPFVCGVLTIIFFALSFLRPDPESWKPFIVPSSIWPFITEWLPVICWVIAALLGLCAVASFLPEPRQSEAEPATLEDVRARLVAKKPSRFTAFKAAAILLVSLVAFYALGLTLWDPAFIVLLVMVVLIHELGHIAAMWLFGYRDLRILFIPLFGALAAGRPARTEGWQRAIVSLAGPLPGMGIGYALLFIALYADSPAILMAGLLFLVLNMVNLLPIFPLDGGHFVNEVLLSRNRWIELLFRIGAAVTLLALAVALRSVILGIFGALMLFTAWRHVTVSAVADDVRASLPEAAGAPPDEVPPEAVEMIFTAVREREGDDVSAAVAAATVQQAWMLLTRKPPGAIVTLGLTMLYLVAMFSVLLVPMVLGFFVGLGVLEPPHVGAIGEFLGFVDEVMPDEPH